MNYSSMHVAAFFPDTLSRFTEASLGLLRPALIEAIPFEHDAISCEGLFMSTTVSMEVLMRMTC
jgi:hypothetical protein